MFFALSFLITQISVSSAGASPMPGNESIPAEFKNANGIVYSESEKTDPASEAYENGMSWENFNDGSPLVEVAVSETPEDHDAGSGSKALDAGEKELLTSSMKMKAERSLRQALDVVTIREEDEQGMMQEAVFFDALQSMVRSFAAADGIFLDEVKESAVSSEEAAAKAGRSISIQFTVAAAPMKSLELKSADVNGDKSSPESVKVMNVSGPALATAVQTSSSAKLVVLGNARDTADSYQGVSAQRVETKVITATVVTAASEIAIENRERQVEGLMKMLGDYVEKKIASAGGFSSEESENSVEDAMNHFLGHIERASRDIAQKIRDLYMPERMKRNQTLARTLRLRVEARQAARQAAVDFKMGQAGLPGYEAAALGVTEKDAPAETEENSKKEALSLLQFMGIDEFHPWFKILLDKKLNSEEREELRAAIARLSEGNRDEENAADARYRGYGLRLGMPPLTLAYAMAPNLGPYLPPGFHYQSSVNEQRQKILSKTAKLYDHAIPE